MFLCRTFSIFICSVLVVHISLCQLASNAGRKIKIAGADHPRSLDELPVHASSPTLDTLFSFPAPGTFPTGLAWDGIYFWHADYNQDRIYKLTTTGNVVSSFDLPSQVGSPAGIEWDGTSLWVVNESLGRVFILDTAGTLLRSFGLPDSASGDPQSWGLAWDGQFMWHSQYEFQARIFKLDPATGQVLSSFVPPTHLILDIAWANGFLFGVDLSTRLLYKMNPADGSVVATESWQVPYPLGLLWDGLYFWNVSGSGLGRRRIYQVSSSIVTLAPEKDEGPLQFFLAQNYPNPFNPSTTISFSLPAASFVTLKIYNLLGQEIATPLNELKQPGVYEVVWNATGTPNGVYVYRILTDDYVATKKMVVMK